MAIRDLSEELTPTEVAPITPHKDVSISEPTVITENKFPTEIVELPSKGLLYPSDSVLSSGKLEMKYMTTKEEDILSTTSYIRSGVVLDKLFQSMLVTKFKYDDLLLGDRNAVMIAARIYGYGPIYEAKVTTPSGATQPVQIDLTKVRYKEVDESLITKGSNIISFKLPQSGHVIEFSLLTVGMQKDIDTALERQRKYAPKDAPEENLTTRLRYMIKSVDGVKDSAAINSLVLNMKVQDSRALREFIGKVQPDVDLTIEVVDEATNQPFRSEFSLGLDLFWPDYKG